MCQHEYTNLTVAETVKALILNKLNIFFDQAIQPDGLNLHRFGEVIIFA
ncbi:hypothetical protein HCUR_01390 [Holospora curviuscula]|uniref:Uncharacterized protein n=1 Tax=Holospora curviuscula TaxID=1082868 RepID=A0A2S5R752_9PROT|nr:hypothetical protein HCUR_01390 [Holospora curviuscula]